MKDVYAKEPWLLDHSNDPFFKEDEWYYFSARTQISEKKIGHGNYSKRKITRDDNDGIDRGKWRWTRRKKISLRIVVWKIQKYKKSKKDKKDHQHEASSSSKPQPIKKKKSKKDHHDEASTSYLEQQPINIECESLLAAYLEQEQPLLWDVPNKSSSSCSVAETESRMEKET
ncbi:putative transcription factor NAM family [Arabidopsis thaliana]|uniref:NAC (No Apical Meristem) domain transcriptional regulator superfamily protein n=3 Tax=Arabidopsis TaxID=3701 RepID=Q9C8B5_ARATH|nr:NAC (No Apical Meristem) domain transcriptional regulator superfamily protein [Arabidopsis thaliana]KAG7648566.1 NAC domain superfamily [Arabidopsis thaliana x Arabidopsis arenosa]AAG51085.1 hypothetical protein [Arabidopsis thaliana]AEE31834.1 NAC (No Apical Meristem) domain transcriptional regulator superfamily protein [Arabidopsis thaliana]OAP18008.1 hypothetical protein AXX17_AT1G36650 [Arabidopsis thaliana]OAP18950.1 hypothetical protein AXX17_AT1G36660 [Arabidopsis thaliana]|eukprot:NP_174823.1 NAC (No Apical Meristem) domain transcriptional regulator superfamily protein [Arabidopsis thaliana]